MKIINLSMEEGVFPDELKIARVIPLYKSNDPIRKSKDYVYGIWMYKALDIWKGYYRVKKITGFVRETVNRGKK